MRTRLAIWPNQLKVRWANRRPFNRDAAIFVAILTTYMAILAIMAILAKYQTGFCDSLFMGRAIHNTRAARQSQQEEMINMTTIMMMCMGSLRPPIQMIIIIFIFKWWGIIFKLSDIFGAFFGNCQIISKIRWGAEVQPLFGKSKKKSSELVARGFPIWR